MDTDCGGTLHLPRGAFLLALAAAFIFPSSQQEKRTQRDLRVVCFYQKDFRNGTKAGQWGKQTTNTEWEQLCPNQAWLMSAVCGQEFREEEVMNRTRAVQKGLKKGIVWENHISFCFSCLCNATMKLLSAVDNVTDFIQYRLFVLLYFIFLWQNDGSFVSPNNCAVLSRRTSVVMMFVLFIYFTIESWLGKFNGNRVCVYELMVIKCCF